MFPSHIFKAYDIRGLYPVELNEDLAYKIARAYGAMRQEELGRADNITIVVGRDMRLSSPTLSELMVKGLLDQGINVVDVGLVSTPTFYFAVAYYGYDGGVQITASHNPKEYNGIKLTRAKAAPVGQGIGMERLRELVENDLFLEPAQKGALSIKENVLDGQVKFEETYADISKIKKFKIVADTANSLGSLFLDRLFQDLPQVELIRMNWELDGTFPSHAPNPFEPANVRDLEQRVLAEKADLGIATDGDGDRIFFVDDEGKTIEPSILRGIIAKSFLQDNPGAKICYDIRPGRITPEMIKESGGLPVITKVGHSFIKKTMLEEGAVFGGESSGHFIVKFPQGVYEAPVVVVLKLLQELSEFGKKLSEYVKPFKKYWHTGELNFKLHDRSKVAEILNNLKIKFHDAEVDDLDGLTFTYPTFWFNVRASNTEPLLRLSLEAISPEIVQAKVAEVKSIINQ